MMIKSNCVDILLKKLFYNLGLIVAKYPGYFIIVPIFLSLICMTGFQKLHYEMDSEYLFSPVDGPGKAERRIVESFFKTNYSQRFNPSRITRQGRYAKIIAIPKVGDNMLTSAVWKELRLLDDAIKNIAIAFGDPEEIFTYREICARWMGECFENDIINLDQIMDQIEKKQLNLTFPVMLNPVTWDAHAFPAFFGKSLVSQDDIIESVPSVQLMYFITTDTKLQDDRGALWEEAFLTTVENLEKNNTFQLISTARFASRTLDIELEKNTRSVIPYFTVTFIVMIIFSICTCMMTDWVRSKPMLGLLGNISAAMGTLAAFGLAVYMGYDFIGIILAAPFLTCSIGIDDTFVMLAAWRRTPVTMNVPERVANMLSEAAVSVTITSLTDIVSLYIGKTSPFPAIQLFCIYTGLAVTFILIWHITFFTACVAVYGYLEQKNAHCVTCVPVLPVSLAHEKSWLYRIFCTGGINPKDPDNPEDNPENSIMVWCRDNLGNGLNRWPVKILVILLFLAYLAGAIYGITIIQEGLQRSKLSQAGSYSIEFYEREDFYFREYSYRIQVVIDGELDYGNVSVRNGIENLTAAFESSPFVSSSPMYTESWLRAFLSYVGRNGNIFNVSSNIPMKSFTAALQESWLFPSNPYSLDVKFNEDESKILASRFIIQTVNITNGNIEKDMVNDLRRIAQQSSLNVTVFHPYFLFFDQFELVRPTTIQSTIYGGIIVMIITFLFIPNFSSSIWVAFSIVSIEFGVIGYMALWNVNLDSISMVNLIMCVGFSVDFTAHICYAYMSSDKNNCKERTKESLYSLGLPIIQGACSTILGVGALLFVGSYIFLVFFKIIFLVTFFGAMHGILLLPVLLSLFERNKSTKVDKKCTPAYCIPHATLPPPPPPPMSHLHNPKHFGIPLHGMVQGSSMVFYNVDKKYYGEKDLGLGTSEDSSDTSSFQSQNKKDMHQKYVDGWKKSSPSGRPYSKQDYIDEHHWNNISMEFLNRTKVNHNGVFLQQRNFYKDKD